MAHYKFLSNSNLAPVTKFDYTDYIPGGSKGGEWLPETEYATMCAKGYHAATIDGLSEWANDKMFLVQFDGDVISYKDKACCKRMRFVGTVDNWTWQNRKRILLEFVKFLLISVKKKDKSMYVDLLGIVNFISEDIEQSFTQELRDRLTQWYSNAPSYSAKRMCLDFLMTIVKISKPSGGIFREFAKDFRLYGRAHGGQGYFEDHAVDFMNKTIRDILELDKLPLFPDLDLETERGLHDLPNV
jgi:hypothetical protein